MQEQIGLWFFLDHVHVVDELPEAVLVYHAVAVIVNTFEQLGEPGQESLMLLELKVEDHFVKVGVE